MVPANAQDKLGPTARKLQSLGENVPVPSLRNEDQRPTLPIAKQNDETPPLDKVEKPVAPIVQAPKSVEISSSTCLADLKRIAVAEAAVQPKSKDSQCKIAEPVSLTATKGKNPVAFSAGLTLDCPFALALAQFTNETIQPLAQYHLGSTVQQLQTGTGYTCRRRNNLATGKLSEHAFGNAIDIVGFKQKDKSSFEVKKASLLEPKQARFQRALRKAACGTFTTVLGPGSNAAHATHLHFDLGRSGKKNPYRICD